MFDKIAEYGKVIAAIATLVIVVTLIIVKFTKKEHFAEFSADRRDTSPFIKPLNTDSMYNSIYRAVAYFPAIEYMKVQSHNKDVLVDIGDGKAAVATVQIPAQIVQNVPAQSIKADKKVQTSDVVFSQVVQLPEQKASLPIQVEGGVINVPVKVDSQTVTIKEQNAVKTSLEKFKIVKN